LKKELLQNATALRAEFRTLKTNAQVQTAASPDANTHATSRQLDRETAKRELYIDCSRHLEDQIQAERKEHRKKSAGLENMLRLMRTQNPKPYRYVYTVAGGRG